MTRTQEWRQRIARFKRRIKRGPKLPRAALARWVLEQARKEGLVR